MKSCAICGRIGCISPNCGEPDAGAGYVARRDKTYREEIKKLIENEIVLAEKQIERQRNEILVLRDQLAELVTTPPPKEGGFYPGG